MDKIVFLYKKNGSYQCLDSDEEREKGRQLVIEGWQHIETIDSVQFTKNFFHSSMYLISKY